MRGDTHVAVITGDPERATRISSFFDKAEMVSNQRGFIVFQVWQKEIPVWVVSTNIGGPSTAIGVEELIEAGVTMIIRQGTCGAIQPFIKPGQLIIPSACVREEGTSRQYIDLAYPAVPDTLLFSTLHRYASESHHPFHTGIIHCKDAYYLERPEKQIDPETVHRIWAKWRTCNVLVTEMESSVLFVLGALRGIRTGTVLINIGNSTPDFDQALEISVQIIRQTIEDLTQRGLVPEPKPACQSGLSYLDKISYQGL